MKLDRRKAASIILILIFILSVSLFLVPVIYEQLGLGRIGLKEVEVVNIDTGERYSLGRVKSSKMLFIVYDGLVGPEVDGIAKLLNELGLYAESTGYKIIIVLSGDNINSFREYVADKYPILLNKYTWVYDPNGLVSNIMGHGSSRGRIYTVSSDWSFKFIGDTRTPTSLLMSRLK